MFILIDTCEDRFKGEKYILPYEEISKIRLICNFEKFLFKNKKKVWSKLGDL